MNQIAHIHKSVPGRSNQCLECGTEIKRKTSHGRPVKFCSTEHRKAWNNRRMTRGAILYDEIMKWRFDRANNKDAVTTMAQIASMFRDNDKRDRDGRRSWIDDPNRDTITVASEAA